MPFHVSSSALLHLGVIRELIFCLNIFIILLIYANMITASHIFDELYDIFWMVRKIISDLLNIYIIEHFEINEQNETLSIFLFAY